MKEVMLYFYLVSSYQQSFLLGCGRLMRQDKIHMVLDAIPGSNVWECCRHDSLYVGGWICLIYVTNCVLPKR
jgi:hypothetical protein